MGHVHLDHVKADFIGPPSRCNKVIDDLRQPVIVQRGRGLEGLVVSRGRGGNGLPAPRVGCRDRRTAVPRQIGRGLAPGVGQLNAHGRVAVVAAEPDHAGQSLLILVGPQPQTAGGNPRLRADAGGFHEDQAHTADRELTQVHQVPVGGAAVVGAVLAHGRHHDPVAQFDPAQGDRRKQLRRTHRRKIQFCWPAGLKGSVAKLHKQSALKSNADNERSADGPGSQVRNGSRSRQLVGHAY
ncbi:MAG: Uncharacterised protein [Rhodospirillaceae bacterium]|nr:MAG: Uncharacterised protein [Rhodospirillaceae bacterium]